MISARSRGAARRRRRSRPVPFWKIGLKAVAFLGVIGAFLAFGATVNRGVPGRDYRTVLLDVPAAGSLRAHDKVAIGGVRVGQVKDLATTPHGARIELQIEPGVDLPADTKVKLRANGLLGARYVQLVPGKATEQLADRAVIRGNDSTLTSNLPDALDVFDAQTRGALGTAVKGLGAATLGNGERLNELFGIGAKAAPPFIAMLETILRRTGSAARLAPALERVTVPLADVSPDLRKMLDPGSRALRPLVDERAALRASLDDAPAALRAADSGLGAGTRLLAAVGRLTETANGTLPYAPESLTKATKLLRTARTKVDGDAPLKRVTSLLHEATEAVPRVLRVTDAARPVLPRIDSVAGDLSPVLRYIAPYGCDVINTAITLRSMTGFVGTGEGPNGPPSQFRLQLVASLETAGIKEPTNKKIAYHAPCKYLGRTYNVLPLLNLGKGE